MDLTIDPPSQGDANYLLHNSIISLNIEWQNPAIENIGQYSIMVERSESWLDLTWVCCLLKKNIINCRLFPSVYYWHFQSRWCISYWGEKERAILWDIRWVLWIGPRLAYSTTFLNRYISSLQGWLETVEWDYPARTGITMWTREWHSLWKHQFPSRVKGYKYVLMTTLK